MSPLLIIECNYLDVSGNDFAKHNYKFDLDSISVCGNDK